MKKLDEKYNEVLEVQGLEKFRSARDLGLGEQERCVLIKALAYLENQKIGWVHADRLSPGNNRSDYGEITFNMAHWGNTHSCGTTCCLGGTAEVLGGLPSGQLQEAASWLNSNRDMPGLSELFGFGRNHWSSLVMVTERQAAVALRDYLETGFPDWDKAKSSPR